MNKPKANAPTEIAAWLRKAVADCLKLPLDRIDQDVSLTRYGLDSCSAIQLTTEIASKLQRSVPETLLLSCPSVSALEAFMSASSSDAQRAFKSDSDAMLRTLLADSVLPNDICPNQSYSPTNFENILLTGATGFLGAFMLRSLLRNTDATVHCLVRPSKDDPLERICRNLTKYGLWDDQFAMRLQGWAGDLQMPQLGLTPEAQAWLASGIDAIYHCGALVNWVLPYDELRSVNVLGTQELLRLACQGRRKPFHFISSLATCHTTCAVGEVTEQDETLAFVAGNHLGYAQSKCVAESLVRRASERGLPATIHRPSLIIGDVASAQTNSEDLLSSIIRGCIAMGAAPDLDWMLDCCTVDFVAKAIVNLSQSSTVPLNVFHLVNPVRYHWREVVLWMNLYGYPLRLIPYRQWLAELRIAASESKHPLYRFRGFFFAKPKADCNLTLPELYEDSRRNSVDSKYTERELLDLGLKCPVLGASMLEDYFSALIEQGAIPAARGRVQSKAEPTDWSRGFVQSLLREYFDDHSLQVQELSECRIADHGSITTELTSWGQSSRIGIWENCVEITRSGKSETQTLELVIKAKPIDCQVIEAAEKVGTLCDPHLGEMLRKHRDRLGILGCHTRELNIYRQQDPRFLAHVPRVYATIERPERSEWMLVLESLTGMKLMDSTNNLAQWQSKDIEVAIEGLAQLHSVWYERDAELSERTWLRSMLTTGEVESMSDLWHALAEYSWKYFFGWLDAEAREVIARIGTSVGSWWAQLEQLPQTLIHNDFNPRNLALRNQNGEYRLCAYDWELATLGVPQHDLAEFLCFVLPQDSSRETIMSYIDRHRAKLELATDGRIDPVAWNIGFQLSLRHLILNRFPMYCLMHTFRKQSFLPKVIKTWWRMHNMFSLGT